MAYRDNTKVVKIGDRLIGGGNPILIQSMTNTRTEDVKATVEQIHRLEQAGCEIIRCTVPTIEAAKAIAEIKKEISIPLVADIHFDYKMAIAAMEYGADKIRINPGNIGGKAAAPKRDRSRSGWVSTAAPWRKTWWKNTGASQQKDSSRAPWTRLPWSRTAVMIRS